MLVQKVPFYVVDVVLEQLSEDYLEVYRFVTQATEQYETQSVRSFEHVELVLVGTEVPEGRGVAYR